MAEQQNTPEYSAILSSEEWFYLLTLLDKDAVVGFDPGPLRALPEDQRNLVLATARNGLRARGLIRITDGGSPGIQEALLTTLSVCIYPRSVVTIFHWLPDQELPTAATGYLGMDEDIFYTEPEPDLHFLARSSSEDGFFAMLAEFCQWPDEGGADAYEFQIPTDAFIQMRQAAEENQLEKARRIANTEAPEEAIEALIQTLANGPAASVVRAIKRDEQGVTNTDFTILQGGSRQWMIASPNASDSAANVVVRTVTTVEILSTLSAAL